MKKKLKGKIGSYRPPTKKHYVQNTKTKLYHLLLFGKGQKDIDISADLIYERIPNENTSIFCGTFTMKEGVAQIDGAWVIDYE